MSMRYTPEVSKYRHPAELWWLTDRWLIIRPVAHSFFSSLIAAASSGRDSHHEVARALFSKAALARDSDSAGQRERYGQIAQFIGLGEG